MLPDGAKHLRTGMRVPGWSVDLLWRRHGWALALPLALLGGARFWRFGTGATDRPFDFSLFADDFFFYYVTAKNFVEHGQFSFDGTTFTNGFHPAWEAVVALIYFLSGQRDAAALPAILALTLALAVVAALLVLHLLGRVSTQNPGTPPAGAWIFAALYGLCALRVAGGGMEVALTLALAPGLLILYLADTGGRGRLLAATLLASALTLSRLDALLLAAPIWLALACRMLLLGQVSVLGAATMSVLGWMPLLAYLGWNLSTSGALLPQSAAAKAIMGSPGPYLEPLQSLFAGLFRSALAGFYLVMVAAAAATWVRTRQLAPTLAYVLLWPAIFYLMLSMRSSWTLWIWYLYPLVACLPVAWMVIARNPHGGFRRWSVVLAGIFAAYVFADAAIKEYQGLRQGSRRGEVSTRAMAFALASFAKAHPGRYAMGDGAGIVGYLIGQPLTQLEGLVGGRPVIEAIRREDNLNAFLAASGVDYYVGTNLARDADGCHLAVEPAQGGAAARRMKGRFCGAPELELAYGNRTQVFAVAAVAAGTGAP